MKHILLCVLSAVTASGVTTWLLGTPAPGPAIVAAATATQEDPGTLPPSVFNDSGLTPDEAISVFVYEKNNRSVVNITTRVARSGGLFGIDNTAEDAGSGTVIDKQGRVLTNYHVVEGAREVRVTLFNGDSYEARLVGADPINDTAVIQIDAPDAVLHPAVVGDSQGLRVGMRVFAIGNPFGYERTMTTGIISSLNRSLQVTESRSIKSIIQVDAAINPGNSGGPLFDVRGRLIGMTTAIATRTGQSAGIGFAIPINLINRVVPQLVKNGRVIRPEIGILRVYETGEGLLVQRLTPGGAAERAGLRGPRITRERRGPWVVERTDRNAADLIVGVDGKETKTVEEFLSYVDEKNPGDEVLVTVIRERRRMAIPVILGG